MTTTTGDPSILKTPATLSGGDLVSRLLAATPPYLYNVPLTPHSFFFSEMLRSFVQAKTEGGNPSVNPPSAPRRRKRSWRDARDRPLELTTKDKAHHHLHHHHHHHHQQQQQQQQQQQHQQHKDKYFQTHQQQQQQQQQQQHQSQPEIHLDNRFKTHSEATSYSTDSKIQNPPNYEQKTSSFVEESSKSMEDGRTDFCKQSRGFYDDSSRLFSSEQSAHQEALFAAATGHKVKPEESHVSGERKNCNYTDRSIFEERAKLGNQEQSFMNDKTKMEFAGRNFLPGIAGTRNDELQQAAKNFGVNGVVPNSEFLPTGPLWYPPYPGMPQNYPAIDPLHFFIDLRVSGHIWDRKMNERQLPFKSKHCSAFSVPQTKEYNRPLNLTRDEAATTSGCSSSASSSSSSGNNATKNSRGTHAIMRHLTETYKGIRDSEKNGKIANSDDTTGDYRDRATSKNDGVPRSSSSSSREHQPESGEDEPEGKDLRALIGLELVVDYVKEPKKDPSTDEEQSTEVGE